MTASSTMPRANRSEPKVSLESVHSQPPLTSIHLRRCWDCRYQTPIGLIQHCFDQWGEQRESNQKRAAPAARGTSLPPCTASSGAGWERWAVFRTWSTKVTSACSYICKSECSPFFRNADLLCETHAIWMSKNRSQHHSISLYYSISSLFPLTRLGLPSNAPFYIGKTASPCKIAGLPVQQRQWCIQEAQ